MTTTSSALRRRLLAGAFALVATVTSQAADSARPAIHGAVSATAAYSDTYNFLGDTRRNLDLNVVEAIINGSHRFENGIRASAQLYGYKLDDYRDLALDFASLDYSFVPQFGVRAGRLKRASGLYGDSQDIDVLRPFAFLPLDMYPKTLRPLVAAVDGAAIYGNIALGRAGSLNYQVAYGLLPKIDTKSPYLVGITENGLSTGDNIDADNVGVLAIGWNLPVDGLRVLFTANRTTGFELNGVMRTAAQLANARSNNRATPNAFPPGVWNAIVAGRPGTLAGELNRYVWSAEYTKGDWQFAAEYLLNDNKLSISYPAPLGARQSRTKNDSYYFMTTWQAAAKVQLGAYYGEGFGAKDDHDGKKITAVPSHTGYLKDLAVASAFNLTSWSLLKAEVHFLNGTKDMPISGNIDATRWKSNWTYFVLKTTVSF